MNKLKILLPVLMIVFLAIAFWSVVSLKVMLSFVDRDQVYKFYQIISAKYYDNIETDKVSDTDSGILNSQSLYDVKSYKLDLSFDILQKKIIGSVNMNSESLSDTLNLIYIDLAGNMTVNSVKLNGDEIPHRRFDDYITADTKSRLKLNESFDIQIVYEGIPENKGFDSFSIKKFDDEPAIYTLSEPNHAKTWWPCKDVITDKADAKIILTVPGILTAVSNGLLTDVSDNEDGSKTFHWKTSYPTATYLVSLAIGKYDKWTDTYNSMDGKIQMPVEYYTYPYLTEKAKYDWKNTVDMLEFFSGYIGEYPFINEKYGMATFGWVGGAMEHQTISSMGYTLVTGNGKYEDIVVHELVHQWFGDAVTPASWKDIWLNEGFASYGEALWVEHKNGKEALKKFMKKSDYSFFMGTVYDPEGYIFGPTVYKKGSWCLHMLRGVTGDSLFRQIIRTYYEEYKYKNADTYQFKKICEDITGNDLNYFFNQWIFTGAGRPEYSYSWNYEKDDASADLYKVSLMLKQNQDDMEVYSMPLKILFKTNAGEEEITVFNDRRSQQIDHSVKGIPLDVIVDNDNWVLKKIKKEENN
ncbi:MAG: M1 family metallopeptidase [Ignavibacteria bacterium]|nr:M1 family metallopeptidase [Ignavibacteria bacterium]